MFLDDQLYLHVKNRKIGSAADLQSCINECYRLCENYYKARLNELANNKQLTYKLGTVIMDKTFKFWDMFIEKLNKDNYVFTDVFIMPGVSYKDAFMSNPELKRIYELGK